MQTDLKLGEDLLGRKHTDKIHQFRCYDEKSVELFLKEESLNLMDQNFVRTRLFFDDKKNLVGFYSLFNDTIKINKQKRQELNVKLPDQVNTIPAIRLHYIGVDERYRKNRYGEYLLLHSLRQCAEIAKNSGCTLIVLESTPDAKSFYEKYGFTSISKQGIYTLMAYNTINLIPLLSEQ